MQAFEKSSSIIILYVFFQTLLLLITSLFEESHKWIHTEVVIRWKHPSCLYPNSVTMYQLSTFFLRKCAPLVHCDGIGDWDQCPHLKWASMLIVSSKPHWTLEIKNKKVAFHA